MGEIEQVVTAEIVTRQSLDPPLRRLVAGWLAGRRSDKTRKAYTEDLERWFAFLAEHGIEPLAAQTDHVEAYMRVCEHEIDPRTGEPWRPATVARRVSVVSSFYIHCKRRKAIDQNPAEDTSRPPIDYDHSETVGLTMDEAQRLIATANRAVAEAKLDRSRRAAARDAAIIATLLCTGCRISEVTTARIEDLGYDRGHRVLFVKRKGGKRQSVALGVAAAVVDQHVALQGRESGLIFCTSSGQQVDRAYLSRVIRRVALVAHLPAAKKLSPHSLRHTFATLAFDNGSDISVVQDAMGHADPRTTRRYDRARNRIDKSPVHAVAKQLLGGP